MTMRDALDESGGSILLIAVGNGFSYGVLVSATMHIRYSQVTIEPQIIFAFQ